jgi:hypothetical protein
MQVICEGALSNGMSVRIQESGAILTKEVVVEIGGIGCEIFQISSQKKMYDGVIVSGNSISPKIKKPQFIRCDEPIKASL